MRWLSGSEAADCHHPTGNPRLGPAGSGRLLSPDGVTGMVLGLHTGTVTMTTQHVQRQDLERGVSLEPPNPRDGPCHPCHPCHGSWLASHHRRSSPAAAVCLCRAAAKAAEAPGRIPSSGQGHLARPGQAGHVGVRVGVPPVCAAGRRCSQPDGRTRPRSG